MVRGVQITVAALSAVGVVLLAVWGFSLAVTGTEFFDVRWAGVALFVAITALSMATIGFVALRAGHVRD